jgi:hypothetical protein
MGAATGLDSGEARSRRRMPSNATAPTTKNSLCLFWNDWNQNCEGVMNLSTDTACRRGDLLAVELGRPTHGVDGKAGQEDAEQHQREGVLVEGEDDPAPAGRAAVASPTSMVGATGI